MYLVGFTIEIEMESVISNEVAYFSDPWRSSLRRKTVVTWTHGISAVTDAERCCMDTNKLLCSVKFISLALLMKESWHRQGLIQVLWGLKLIQFWGGLHLRKRIPNCKNKIRYESEYLLRMRKEITKKLQILKSWQPTTISRKIT